MTTVIEIATFLGSPLAIVIALAIAAAALEIERRWTRSRRFRGQTVGELAFALDILTLLGVLLAIVGLILALFRIITAWLQSAGSLISAMPWLAAIVGGIATGAILTLLVMFVFLRRAFLNRQTTPAATAAIPTDSVVSGDLAIPRTPRAPEQAEPVMPAPIQQPPLQSRVVPPPHIYREAPPDSQPSAPVSDISATRAPDLPEVEPALVMLRRRTPPPSTPTQPESFSASPAATVAPRHFNWIPVVLAILVLGAALGYYFRDPVMAAISNLPLPQTVATSASVAAQATVVPQATVAPTPIPTEPTATPQVLRVAVDRLNLRAGPGTDQAVVATLERAAEVRLLGETSGSGEETWVKVRAGDVEGWIYRAFLE